MPSQLLARSASAAIVVMTVAVVALGAPLPTAQAAQTHASASVLAEGAGLGAAPSIAVRRVQRILDRRGFDLGSPGVDGRFGPLTAAAVRRAQARYGLAADGVVGPKTRRLLALLAPSSRRPPRQPRATQSPPPTTQKPQTTPATPQATPRQPTATVGRTPRDQAPARAVTTRGDSTLSIVLAALAALLSAAALTAAVTRRRRRHDEAPLLSAIDRDLYVEGRSERAEVGAFRGFALATAIPRDADDPRSVRYLVDDPRKPAPVWIEGGEISRSPSQLAPGEPVIGYVTTDPDPVREEEAFLEIEGMCEQAGWKLEEIIRDRDTGPMVGRPGLMRALESIAQGDARGLIVSDARSLVRSLGDLAALLEWFRDAEAALVARDIDLDTATIHGYQTASTLIAVSGWERQRTASRARRGLARVQTPDRTTLVERIHAMRAGGLSLQAIADQLNNEGVPPLGGGTGWRPAAISTVLGSPPRRSLRDELPAIPTRDRQG